MSPHHKESCCETCLGSYGLGKDNWGCIDKGCPCHQETGIRESHNPVENTSDSAHQAPIPVEGWGNELRDSVMEYGNACAKADKTNTPAARMDEGVKLENLKSLIHQTLLSDRQAYKDSLREKVRKTSWSLFKCGGVGKDADAYVYGYNQAKDDILNALDEK